MGRRIQNNLKECALALLMFIIVAFGVISSAGAINYAVKSEEWLYLVVGICNIPLTVFSGVLFYRAYLKPTES